VSLYHNWKARRRARELLRLTPEMLGTLGLRERDVAWAIHLPLRFNPLLALEDCSRGRFQGSRTTPKYCNR
jgi:hypothetical protein